MGDRIMNPFCPVIFILMIYQDATGDVRFYYYMFSFVK